MTITRFAPSPTGHLHVGNLRTALFNFLITLASRGTFILRLDDTDPERSRPEFADSIRRDLEWLGLHWSRVERQSARLDRYREAADQLRRRGRLYECFETQGELALRRKTLLSTGKPPIYDRSALALSEEERQEMRRETPGYWRFLLDGSRTGWSDGIQSNVSIDTSSLSDPVLIRADGQVLYTLASVVDDLDMGVTDVVRGADHITNTAVQIQIMRCFGNGHPAFAHHSLLTGPKGEPLSKRLGALAVGSLREQGVEPMALLSLLAFSGSGQPMRLCGTLEELAGHFQLDAFSAAPVRFDETGLSGLTSRSLAQLPFGQIKGQLREYGVPDHIAEPFWNAVRMNLDRRADLRGWWHMLRDGAEPLIAENDRGFITDAFQLLRAPPYDSRYWNEWTQAVSSATGRKGRRLYMPLRKALTGRERGPEMQALMPLMQKVTREF